MCIPESVHIEPEQHLWFPLYSQFFQWEGSLQHQHLLCHFNTLYAGGSHGVTEALAFTFTWELY